MKFGTLIDNSFLLDTTVKIAANVWSKCFRSYSVWWLIFFFVVLLGVDPSYVVYGKGLVVL